MTTNESSRSGGVGVAGLLGVAFIVLKLVHVIDWPWIWVLAPFWIGLAVCVVVHIVIALVAVAKR